jgi:hypothetical protein
VGDAPLPSDVESERGGYENDVGKMKADVNLPTGVFNQAGKSIWEQAAQWQHNRKLSNVQFYAFIYMGFYLNRQMNTMKIVNQPEKYYEWEKIIICL